MPHMRQQGWGRIINVASESGIQPDPFMPHYNASKAAFISLTKSLSKAYREEEILVNAVSPGRIDTPFHDEFTPDEKREEGAQQIPLGREGTPEEVVGAVLFLASSHANYILGEVIEVNGGMLMD